MELTHRDSGQALLVTSEGDDWTVAGADPTAARLAKFLLDRCPSNTVNPGFDEQLADWDHDAALERAERVVKEFESPELEVFDSHLFWGSWKWIGWYATEFTWVGRWIMASVLKRDPRGVPLCIDWLRQGTFNDAQSGALRHALMMLTGESFPTDSQWLKWYDGGMFKKGAKRLYPEPDFDTWLEELKSEYGESAGSPGS